MVGSIEYRPDRPKPYRARYWGLDGKQHRKSFASEKDANRWLTVQEAAKLDQTWTAPGRGKLRFKVWADQWWDAWKVGKAPNTLQTRESHLRLHLRPFFDPRMLDTISYQVVQRWQNELAASTGHDTVLACRSILNQIMEAAKKDRRIPINPVRLVEPPAAPVDPDVILGQEHRRAYTPAEFAKLLAQTPAFYWDHFITQVGTGLRPGELLGLPPWRVYLDQARLDVADVRYEAGRFGSGYKNRPKTIASIRHVPIAPTVVKAVARKLDGCPPDGRVFYGPGGGHGIRSGNRSKLSTGNYRRVYRRAASRAGLTRLDWHGPHDLRHTFSTVLENAGIPARVIDELMGHSEGPRGRTATAEQGSAVGRLYRHLTSEMLERVTAAVEAFLVAALAAVPQPCPEQNKRKGR